MEAQRLRIEQIAAECRAVVVSEFVEDEGASKPPRRPYLVPSVGPSGGNSLAIAA